MLCSMESQKILCDVCGASFTKNKSLLRHVREVHQGMKRSANEKRKAVNEKRKIAEKILLSESDIKEVVMKSPCRSYMFSFCEKDALD